MNITNLEMAQTSIEIFGGFACIMMAVILLMNKNKRESIKLFRWMFGFTAVLFFAEAGAYIYRGNIDAFSMNANGICNIIVFLINYSLVALFIRYVRCLIIEKGGNVSRNYVIIADACFVFAAVIIIINTFTDWMYYFDEMNYYHRNYMWYAYTVVSMLEILMGAVIAIRHRKEISKATLTIIIVYALLPIVMIGVQMFYYGISLSTIAIAVALVIMLIIYLIEWKNDELAKASEMPRSSRILGVIILFIIMVISMSASIISCIVSIKRISDENSQDDSHIIAHMINDRLENEFLKPITVGITMSQDASLKKLLKASNNPYRIADEMAEYLGSIRDGMGYQMVFAASEMNKGYFSYDGLSKVLDVENELKDVWYKDCVTSGEKYVLNVDNDEVNNWAISVFVNVNIYDDNEELLGCCGVGVEMDGLKKMLIDYEEEYGVKINLIKKSGEIQLDSDGSRIENAYLDNSYLDRVGSGEFYYEKLGSTSRLTKYVEDFDWYLVIEDNNPDKINVVEIVVPSIIIFVLGLMMLAFAFSIITIREQKIAKELAERKKASVTDGLTGLYNRRAYEEDLDGIVQAGLPDNLIMVMMDVNGLKRVNDNIGHNAGDELIIGAGNCMLNIFAPMGKVYRFGGDEFAALLRGSREDIEDAVETFRHYTTVWKGELVDELAVSVGFVIAGEHKGLNVDQLKELADKLMYIDKDEYYKRTGKERRK